MVITNQDLIDTKHEASVLDLKFDYYGRRLATSSADGSIHIFDGDIHTASLNGHTGPVLALSWSHPKYGSLVASGGSDQKVVIWKEQSTGKWSSIYEYLGHSGPITSVSFSPYTLGLMLAVSSSDGCVSVLLLDSNEKWTSACFHAHDNGALQVCWSPTCDSLLAPDQPAVKFASSGADGLVKVWTWDQGEYLGETLTRHRASVRALAWDEDLLSGSDEGLVVLWSPSETGWSSQDLAELKVAVQGIAVNECGRQVVVSLSNGESKVFDRNEGWKVLCAVDEAGHMKE